MPALHAGVNYPNLTDRCLQPATLSGSATLPLATVEPRPFAVRPINHDAGSDFQHAGRAPRT